MSSLTKKQIAQIDTYVRKCGIRYYDVRSEIVDHLATDMEYMISEKPGLNYDQIEYRALLNLPEVEFLKIQKEKEQYLEAHWRLTIKKHVLEYFEFPKILLTIALFVGIYFITRNSPLFPIIAVAISIMFSAVQVASLEEKINWMVIKPELCSRKSITA